MKIIFDEIPFTAVDLLAFGNQVQTVGIILNDNKTTYLLPYPTGEINRPDIFVLKLTPDDWPKLLNQLDTCTTLTSWGKGFARKAERIIDAHICWRVYRRDNYTCRYCGAKDRPLTVDHIITWEDGGPSVDANLITSCKPCNRARGNMAYALWLASEEYKNRSAFLSPVIIASNAEIINQLGTLEKLKKTNQRTKR